MKELTSTERAALLASPKYKPARLLSHLAGQFGTTTDSALAARLDITSPQVCHIRHKKYPITSSVIVAILDNTDLTLKELRKLAGMPARKAKRGHV